MEKKYTDDMEISDYSDGILAEVQELANKCEQIYFLFRIVLLNFDQCFYKLKVNNMLEIENNKKYIFFKFILKLKIFTIN